MDKPAVVIELKWDKTAEGAIDQIKKKRYVDALKDYQYEIRSALAKCGDLFYSGVRGASAALCAASVLAGLRIYEK